MAVSSRPFQSQAIKGLVRLYHRLSTIGTRWRRQSQTALSLCLQIALYPVYAVFQVSRLGWRRLQGIALSLGAGAGTDPEALTGDWAIRQILAAVVPAPAGPGAIAPDRAGAALVAQASGQSLAALRLPTLPATLQIRGLACLIGHRTLVLVTADNQIWDGLSTPQQRAIAGAIAALTAGYAHWQRRQQQRRWLQTDPLPLPEVSPYAWPPVRQLIRLMAWMQRGAIARTTNLFHEGGGSSQPPAFRSGSSPVSGSGGRWLIAGQVSLPSQVWPSRRLPLGAIAPAAFQAFSRAEPLASSLAAPAPSRAIPEPRAISTLPWSAAIREVRLLDIGEGIEVSVTAVNYVDAPLVALLRWVDWGLLGLERLGQHLWQWLRSLLPGHP